MPGNERQVAILFADICDSVPLYQSSGDARALAVIARCLDGLAGVAAGHGGEVIRSKGDDVLCVFEQAGDALEAAGAMLEAQGGDSPAIHVGIHFGPVIPARQDIYGDAVNVAARMLALAKAGEVVASRDLVDALPAGARDRLALLGRRPIRGRLGRMEVFSMVLDEGDATQMAWLAGDGTAAPPTQTLMPSPVLELAYRGATVTLKEGDRRLVGRAGRCDLVVRERCVSREHAWVEVRAGRVTLTDQSSTGSWILDAEGRHTTLRREAGVLEGAGVIRLGRHPRDTEPAPELEFRVRMEL